uniref:DCC1-like thiol-disulfide oxidoreductase family protein n=1 Tax=Flavobacterium sp. TaxID=239 RepID=UPI00404B5A27
MKTLNNHTLFYDDACPMCNIYSKGFIKAKMLDSNGRKPFSNLVVSEHHFIDLERAKNEIALVDTNTNTVYYGIDSLLKVIGNSFPWIEKVGNWHSINYILKKLYNFISFNRKVIVPAKVSNAANNQCVPDFNIKYRFFYILFATLFTAIILYQFASLINFLPKANFRRELLLAVGQIAFQLLFIQKLSKQQIINYLGNLVTISMMGSLFLVPVLVLNQFISLNEYIVIAWFMLTVNLMILEHYRRTTLLGLPKHLTITWVLYRILALIIILNF